MIRSAVLALFVALTAALTGEAARAQWAFVPIDRELPAALQGPVRAFLGSLGVPDVEAALLATKTVEPFDRADPEFHILRVEYDPDCHKGRCPTVIAKIERGTLVAQAMFIAEDEMIVGDVFHDFWGRSSVPLMFPSDETLLVLRPTAQGWIVASAVNTLPARDRTRTAVGPSPAAPPPAPKTFEDFQRTLQDLRQ